MRIDFTKTEKEFQLMTLKQGLKQTGVIRVTRSISMILHRSGNNCTLFHEETPKVLLLR
jgi:hypothetical protein